MRPGNLLPSKLAPLSPSKLSHLREISCAWGPIAAAPLNLSPHAFLRNAGRPASKVVSMAIADLKRSRGPAAGEPSEWDALPDGCLTAVLEGLDARSLASARAVCRRVNILADQPALWR